MMLTKLQHWLRAYRRDEKGTIAIETVLMIPALFWAYLAMFAIFHAYHQYSVNTKAAYTIGDMISRQTNPLDNDFIDGSREMVAMLVNAKTHDVAIRVTSIKYDADTDTYEQDWSAKRGWVPALEEGATANWHSKLPVMTDNDRITLVETWVKYDPPFDTGLSDRIVRNFVFTRPRYAPRVLFDNGDQGV